MFQECRLVESLFFFKDYWTFWDDSPPKVQSTQYTELDYKSSLYMHYGEIIIKVSSLAPIK